MYWARNFVIASLRLLERSLCRSCAEGVVDVGSLISTARLAPTLLNILCSKAVLLLRPGSPPLGVSPTGAPVAFGRVLLASSKIEGLSASSMKVVLLRSKIKDTSKQDTSSETAGALGQYGRGYKP